MRSTSALTAFLLCAGLSGAGILLVAATGAAEGSDSHSLEWHDQSSGVSVSLRGLSVVNDDIAWASGAAGVVIRTEDGGQTWVDVTIADAVTLDFRDVEAWDHQQAVVLSAGSPAVAYRTVNGGQTWKEVFRDGRPGIFFDAMSFVNETGLAFSDPIEGRLVLMRSGDRGTTWQPIDADSCPTTGPNEAGFAASGTALARRGIRCWIGLGGGPAGPDGTSAGAARILRSRDGGATWDSIETPIRRAAARGLFSLDFFDESHGVAVGGDYTQPDDRADVAVFTSDGGATWRVPAKDSGPSGYRSCVAVMPDSHVCLCVGRNGTDISSDRGQSWHRVSNESYQAVAITYSGKFAWAVGADGKVGRASLQHAMNSEQN